MVLGRGKPPLSETKKVAVFQPDTARRMWKAYKELKSSGLLTPGVIPRMIERGHNRDNHRPKLVRNTSGEECPPYGCLQIVDTEELTDQVVLVGDKPRDTAGAEGPYVFNNHHPIPDGDTGSAQIRRVGVRALKSAADTTSTVESGQPWGPVVDEWYIEGGGGQFLMIGPDTTRDDLDEAFELHQVAINAGAGTEDGEGKIVPNSIITEPSDSPYAGLKSAQVEVITAPCSQAALIGETVEVIDHLGCILNLEPSTDLNDVGIYFHEQIAIDRSQTASPGDLTPCHWAAFNRCCAPSEGGGTVPGGIGGPGVGWATWKVDSALVSTYIPGLALENVVLCDCRTNSLEVTLSEGFTQPFCVILWRKASNYRVRVTALNSRTINGRSEYILAQQGTAIWFQWYNDGAGGESEFIVLG